MAPGIDEWPNLESRIERNVNKILEMLSKSKVRATFFWLGWVAKRNPTILRLCCDEGHEVASHGYGHLLPFKADRTSFRDDIRTGKDIIEDISGKAIHGFRAPGFGITQESRWAFEEIGDAGYQYDSSVFPARRGHGGIIGAQIKPHIIETSAGEVVEIPISVVEVCGNMINLCGGGYLRLFPLPIIKWGIKRLRMEGRPVIVYLHPREMDPYHQRLPLPMIRQFKTYVNLKSTETKLWWLLNNIEWVTMKELADHVANCSMTGQNPETAHARGL